MFDEVMNTSLHWMNETCSIKNFTFTNTADIYLVILPKILRHPHVFLFLFSYISLEAIFNQLIYFFVLLSVQRRIKNSFEHLRQNF